MFLLFDITRFAHVSDHLPIFDVDLYHHPFGFFIRLANAPTVIKSQE